MIGFFAEIFGRNCQGRAFRRWSSQSGGRGGHCRESWRQPYQCSCNDNRLATHFNENFEAIVKAFFLLNSKCRKANNPDLHRVVINLQKIMKAGL